MLNFRWLVRLSAFMLSAALLLPSQSFVQSVRIFAGRWSSQANFSNIPASNPNPVYNWVGPTWGVIEPTGRIQMIAKNGCQMEGSLTKTPYAGAMWISGDITVTSCENPAMNRSYAANAKIPKGKTNLVLTLDTSTIDKKTFKPADSFVISGVFTKY